MSEDNQDLLQALGALAREQQTEHEQLEGLCAGGKRADRSRATAIDAPLRAAAGDARFQRATAALSAAEHAQIAERVQHALAVDRWRAEQSAITNSQHAALVANIGSRSGRAPMQLVDQPTESKAPEAERSRRFNVMKMTGLVLPLLAAAAAALLFRSPSQSISPLPEYSLQAQGSLEYRAEPAAGVPLRVADGTALRIELRPSTETTGPVDLRVLLQHAGGSLEWPAQIERSPLGSLRLTLARADIAAQGSAELRIVLARPEVLAELGYREETGQRGKGWQAWRMPVELP
jgi:hypothetical protein